MITCRVCGSNRYSKVAERIQGYIDGSNYDIYNCSICNSRFIDASSIDENIYDVIYSDPANIPGYCHYNKIANEITKTNNPLNYLGTESNYKVFYRPILDYFNANKPGLQVLDVGCGMGYLTYAINTAGNTCLGIDISKEGITKAEKRFGPHFDTINLNQREARFLEGNKGKFDVIIACELVEHLLDVKKTLINMLALLKDDGTIIITTPNKDFWIQKDSIRFPELPPVHTNIISIQAISLILNELGCVFTLYDASKSANKNLLLELLYRKYIVKEKTGFKHHIDKKEQKSHKRKMAEVIWNFLQSKPLVIICNFIFRMVYNTIYNTEGIAVYIKKG